MSETFVPVAIALIERDGCYLIRKRPPLPGSPMPGYWEFPGGKCDQSEPLAECVRREVLEEAGLELVVLQLRRVIRHVYPHGAVELHFFDCATRDPRAEPAPATGFVWVPAVELKNYTFPGANDAIVEELVREGRRDL